MDWNVRAVACDLCLGCLENRIYMLFNVFSQKGRSKVSHFLRKTRPIHICFVFLLANNDLLLLSCVCLCKITNFSFPVFFEKNSLLLLFCVFLQKSILVFFCVFNI